MGKDCIHDGQRQLQGTILLTRMLQETGMKKRRAPGELYNFEINTIQGNRRKVSKKENGDIN